MNSATLFPHRHPAAALIAILGSSARAVVDGRASLTDLCVYGRTRVHGWLIGTMKSISRKRKRNKRNAEVEKARRRVGNKDSAVICICVVFFTKNRSS